MRRQLSHCSACSCLRHWQSLPQRCSQPIPPRTPRCRLVLERRVQTLLSFSPQLRDVPSQNGSCRNRRPHAALLITHHVSKAVPLRDCRELQTISFDAGIPVSIRNRTYRPIRTERQHVNCVTPVKKVPKPHRRAVLHRRSIQLVPVTSGQATKRLFVDNLKSG